MLFIIFFCLLVAGYYMRQSLYASKTRFQVVGYGLAGLMLLAAAIILIVDEVQVIQ